MSKAKPETNCKTPDAGGKKLASKRWLLVAACYLLAVLIWLGSSAYQLVRDNVRHANGGMLPQSLTLDDFETEGAIIGEGKVISADPDPQLIYAPGGAFYVDTLVLQAEGHKAGGEMVLYYTAKEGQSYSDLRKVWAQQTPQGSWLFDLGGRAVTSIRWDPGTVPGVVWQVGDITLNPGRPAWQYFVPDTLNVALLVFLPGLFAACLLEASRSVAWLLRQKKRAIK